MTLTNANMIADAKRMIDAFDPETLVYRPGTGAARNVKALVDREPPAGTPEVGQAISKAIRIAVVNQATDAGDDTYGGISATEIDTGRDRIDVARRVGQTAVSRPFGAMVEQDGGMLNLEVR